MENSEGSSLNSLTKAYRFVRDDASLKRWSNPWRKRMPRKPKFKGYDYTELGKAWGLPMSEDCLDDNADMEVIRNHIRDSFCWDKSALDPEVKKDMLKFIDALIKTTLSGYVPVYRAMKKLDDFEFSEVFRAMLPHMWT